MRWFKRLLHEKFVSPYNNTLCSVNINNNLSKKNNKVTTRIVIVQNPNTTTTTTTSANSNGNNFICDKIWTKVNESTNNINEDDENDNIDFDKSFIASQSEKDASICSTRSEPISCRKPSIIYTATTRSPSESNFDFNFNFFNIIPRKPRVYCRYEYSEIGCNHPHNSDNFTTTSTTTTSTSSSSQSSGSGRSQKKDRKIGVDDCTVVHCTSIENIFRTGSEGPNNDIDSMETEAINPFNEKLANEAKKLEKIISTNTGSSVSPSGRRFIFPSSNPFADKKVIQQEHQEYKFNDRCILDPDDFFQDPAEVQAYHEENAILSEWCVINEAEIERFPSNRNYSFDEFNQLCETTEFCSVEYNPEESYVEVQRAPSVISLTSYDVEDEFGIFAQPPEPVIPKIPEASYYREFDYDIQCGLPYNHQYPIVSAFEEIMEETLKHSTTSKDVGAKKKFKKQKDPISVEKRFGLNESGTILLNIDHITEERGYGFMLKRQKKIYRNVEIGKVVNEDFTTECYGLLLVLSAFQNLLHHIFGHPRNKSAPSNGPGESIGAYALTLAKDSKSTFSRNIENFISCTKESREVAPLIVMRNMRQFMSGMKNYLVKHGEGDFQNEVLRARSQLKADEFLNLDHILEKVMHQLVVLPLKAHLYELFVDYYTRTSDIQLLVENVKYAAARSASDFGIRPSVTPPSAEAMVQISLLILRLQEAELPLDKLEYLLAVVTQIFESTTHPRGQALGADDFLPLLVYIVAKCGFIGAEIEAEFMFSLLQQSLLNGEAGYYLTALCSAVHVLKSFMASDNQGTGSLDFRSSSLPACSSVLRVIIPDEYNGSLQTRTLPVRPHTTTREVCRTIAHKARITNPQDYGLYKLVDGEETLLMDSDCPQEARLAARGKHCMLAYKRIDAKIAWPTLTSN